MAEMVIGERVTLEEMGGARMHTSVSGCGHFLVDSDADAIDLARRYLSYMPQSWREAQPRAPRPPPLPTTRRAARARAPPPPPAPRPGRRAPAGRDRPRRREHGLRRQRA